MKPGLSVQDLCMVKSSIVIQLDMEKLYTIRVVGLQWTLCAAKFDIKNIPESFTNLKNPNLAVFQTFEGHFNYTCDQAQRVGSRWLQDGVKVMRISVAPPFWRSNSTWTKLMVPRWKTLLVPLRSSFRIPRFEDKLGRFEAKSRWNVLQCLPIHST